MFFIQKSEFPYLFFFWKNETVFVLNLCTETFPFPDAVAAEFIDILKSDCWNNQKNFHIFVQTLSSFYSQRLSNLATQSVTEEAEL